MIQKYEHALSGPPFGVSQGFQQDVDWFAFSAAGFEEDPASNLILVAGRIICPSFLPNVSWKPPPDPRAHL